MAQPSIKTSFASGEWAPKLRSRVDIAKYHSGAALLRNFYVDYAGGGASTRQGTKFVNQCKTAGARIIPFQPSTTLSYVLEFGQNYIRFFSNGAPIVEAAVAIQSITGSPVTVNSTANGYANGDWVFITGNYYIVINHTTNTYQLTDLFGNNVLALAGISAQRVYTIPSPYVVTDLFPNPATGNPGLKWVQDVTSLIICHPSYQPAILTINSPTSWTLSTINFGSTIPAPAVPTLTSTSASGAGWDYSYLVTAVDINGQESAPSPTCAAANLSYIGTTVMTNLISWTAVSGAISYNVYKAVPSFTTAIPVGSLYGFIGNVTGTSITDAYPGITPDFAQTPPIPENPFLGAGVQSYIVTAGGAYTVAPTATVAAPPNGTTATAIPSLSVSVIGAITHGTAGWDIQSPNDPTGSLLSFSNNLTLKITAVTAFGFQFWIVNTLVVVSPGSAVGGIAANPVLPISDSVPGFAGFGNGFGVSFTWTVTQMVPIIQGTGYITPPVVTFSSGAATATAVLGTASGGNPGVPAFIQERLVLAAQTKSVQSFNFSQPGSFFNFNVSNPVQDDDAISGNIISEELNDIRWMVPVPTGILAGTGKAAWLINGGGGISTQVPITPVNVTAQPQSFNGANDMRPLKINFDMLYMTNKGNYCRDLSYNLYAQIFTGTDISVLSNHLFFSYYFLDWCWAEEPFKTAWLVRNDGQLLSLGYVKEQELTGWAHHDTNGQFQSCCEVIETINGNVVDAVYFVVQRFIDGVYIPYIERMADRYFPFGYEDAWSVDCALQTAPAVSPSTTLTIAGDASVVGNVVTLTDTAGAPFTATMATNSWILRANGGIYKVTVFTSSSIVTATVVQSPTQLNPYTNTPYPAIGGYTIWTPISTVTGLTQLIGQSVVGVADGVVVGPYTVSAGGSVALGLTATKVTLGLQFLPQLQTLPLDLGAQETIQGKRKKIVALTLRVADTLGLSVGKTFQTLVAMKDFTLGNVPTTSTGVATVSGLVNGDGRTILDQEWDTAGNYCIQQNLPYPATVLGVMPETIIGDK